MHTTTLYQQKNNKWSIAKWLIHIDGIAILPGKHTLAVTNIGFLRNDYSGRGIGMGKLITCVTGLLMASCAPYVGYTHLSDPTIDNDGYDLVCVGNGKKIDIGICQNIRGGTYVKVDARLYFSDITQ